MTKKIYALLVGIDNYPDPNHHLQGCANDITAIEEYLNERFNQQEYQLHLQTLKDALVERHFTICAAVQQIKFIAPAVLCETEFSIWSFCV